MYIGIFCLGLLELVLCDSLEQTILDGLLNDTVYDKRVPPGVDYGDIEETNVTKVYVRLLISEIYDINVEDMDFSVTLFLHQEWSDYRLKFNNSYVKRLQLDQKDIDRIWTPDTYFVQAKTGSKHDITKANSFLHVECNGTVLYSIRLSLKLSCQMDFHLYPLDRQECKVNVESFGLTNDKLIYEWHTDHPIVVSRINLPLYFVYGNVTDKDTKYTGLFYQNYSNLELTIKLRRNIGYYLTEVFIPDILIVVMSWVSFWLHPVAVPGRISLGAVTVLTVSSQGSASRRHAPKVSYIKAVDIWTLVHILFVFAAMVEFSIVNVLVRRKRLFPQESTKDANQNTAERPFMRKAKRIDFISRFAFPAAYLAFNIVFWTVALYYNESYHNGT